MSTPTEKAESRGRPRNKRRTRFANDILRWIFSEVIRDKSGQPGLRMLAKTHRIGGYTRRRVLIRNGGKA